MKILFLTHSQAGDRSFGGAMRANAIRDSLLAVAAVDTLMIHGGGSYTAADHWNDERVRAATVSHYGFSAVALKQRSRLKRWVAGIVTSNDYDLIVAQYLDLALLVPSAARARMIFDPDDFRKTTPAAASWLIAAKVGARNYIARRVAKQSLHVWYANPAEEQLPPTRRRSFLPNIVDAPDSARERQPKVRGRLLMVGLFAHEPNVEGLSFFHDRILPHLVAADPAITLRVVGRCDDSLRERLPNADFQGFVDDLASEYDSAHLVIAPILSGGGTQIKVIDALAHGRPMLCSSFAHQGFAADLEDQVHLLVAKSAESWIKQSLRAIANDNEMERIAAQGEAMVRARYGHDRLQQSIEKTIKSLVERAAP